MISFKISKEDFYNALRQLEDAHRLKEQVNRLIKDIKPPNEDFMDGYGLTIDHESLVVNLLEKLTEDEEDWIGYWAWENDYGRELEPDSVKQHGEPVDLRTPSQLYDFLLEKANERANNRTD